MKGKSQAHDYNIEAFQTNLYIRYLSKALVHPWVEGTGRAWPVSSLAHLPWWLPQSGDHLQGAAHLQLGLGFYFVLHGPFCPNVPPKVRPALCGGALEAA